MKVSALRWLFLVLTAATLRGSLDDIPGYKRHRIHRELAEAGTRGAWWVRAEWMAVSVPVADALRLVPALRERKTVARTVEEISGMVAAGKATLHGQPMISLRAGGRAVSESVEEIRFPTENDIGSVPQNFAGNQPTYLPMARSLPAYPGLDTPTAFETMDVGLTLEMAAWVDGSGQAIEVNVVTTHRTLEKWRRALRSADDSGGGIFEQPLSRVFRTTTSIVTPAGEWTLLGVFLSPPSEGRAELSLLRATAQSSPP